MDPPIARLFKTCNKRREMYSLHPISIGRILLLLVQLEFYVLT